MIFLGIDPGMSGGAAWINESKTVDNGKVKAEKFADKTPKDIWEIFNMIKSEVANDQIRGVIEHVHSMPKQGVASSFKFGMNYGLLQGFLYAIGIPFVYVSPQRWQKFMDCRTHGNKNISKDAAQRCFPYMKITHAIADALLLAEYCRRTFYSGTEKTLPAK